jgi:hypothetical protein
MIGCDYGSTERQTAEGENDENAGNAGNAGNALRKT